MDLTGLDPELVKRVRRLVADETGARFEEVSLEARLSHDLGIAGDDGCELMEAFAEEFQVDLTGVDLLGHFGHEGWGVPGCGFGLLGPLIVVALLRLGVESPWALVPALVAPALVGSWILGRGSWRLGGGVPITVRDLVKLHSGRRGDRMRQPSRDRQVVPPAALSGGAEVDRPRYDRGHDEAGPGGQLLTLAATGRAARRRAT